MREVLDENGVLHEELKSTVVQEILRQGVDVPGVSFCGSIEPNFSL